MRLLLLVLIKLYWIVIPEKKRRSCLFKETCSHYVYRHTSEEGFFKGAIALKQRYKKCRKGYRLYSSLNGFELELADGSVIEENEISKSILEPIIRKVKSYSELNRIESNKFDDL